MKNRKPSLKNVKVFVTGALSVIVLASGVAAVSYANHDKINTSATDTSISQNDQRHSRPKLTEEQKTEMEANRTAIETTIESKDYEAWKVTVAKTPRGEEMLKIVENQEEFNKLAEAKSYQDKSQNLMEEIGFNENKGVFGSINKHMNK